MRRSPVWTATCDGALAEANGAQRLAVGGGGGVRQVRRNTPEIGGLRGHLDGHDDHVGNVGALVLDGGPCLFKRGDDPASVRCDGPRFSTPTCARPGHTTEEITGGLRGLSCHIFPAESGGSALAAITSRYQLKLALGNRRPLG